MYYLNLPSRKPVNAELPHEIKSALNIQPNFILKSRVLRGNGNYKLEEKILSNYKYLVN